MEDFVKTQNSLWEQIEKEYGIKFKLADGSFRPVNEWLDDIYLQNPSRFEEMMEDIFIYGDILFADLIKHKE